MLLLLCFITLLSTGQVWDAPGPRNLLGLSPEIYWFFGFLFVYFFFFDLQNS